MSEKKWTPGPWEWHGDVLWEKLADDVRGDVVCRAEFENEHNKDLITAAPDLYDALDRARQKLVGEGFFNASYDCDAALAKARGESC